MLIRWKWTHVGDARIAEIVAAAQVEQKRGGDVWADVLYPLDEYDRDATARFAEQADGGAVLVDGTLIACRQGRWIALRPTEWLES